MNRSSAVMGPEIHSLLRLRSLVLGLGFLLFAFSLLGFIMTEVFLYKSVAELRLGILQRTTGYRSNVIKSCITLRGLFLSGNTSDPASARSISQARANLQAYAQSMSTIHTLNYVDSPTDSLWQFMVSPTRIKTVPMPGLGLFVQKNVSFWDLGNNFVASLLSLSLISVTDLQNSDFSADSMSVDKRAVVFM